MRINHYYFDGTSIQREQIKINNGNNEIPVVACIGLFALLIITALLIYSVKNGFYVSKNSLLISPSVVNNPKDNNIEPEVSFNLPVNSEKYPEGILLYDVDGTLTLSVDYSVVEAYPEISIEIYPPAGLSIFQWKQYIQEKQLDILVFLKTKGFTGTIKFTDPKKYVSTAKLKSLGYSIIVAKH